jgi:hypothetical protein
MRRGAGLKFSGRQFFFLCLVTLLHYLLWVYFINPLPEMDGLAQYYYPVLNYLKTAALIGNDYDFLTGKFFGLHYPHGAAVIAWSLSFLRLGELILYEPYLLHLLLLFPLICAAFFFRNAGFFVTGLIICFFPVSQICLKLFSLQGINVIYGFMAFLCLRSWLVLPRKSFLAAFVFLSWFSIIAKHLGLLFFLILVSSYLTWAIINRKKDIRVYCSFGFILAISLPFYYFPNQMDYVRTSVAHGPGLQVDKFIITAVLLFFLPPLAAFFGRSRGLLKPPPKFFRHGFLLFFGLFFCLIILATNYFSSVHFLVTGSVLLFCLLRFYNLRGVRGFAYIYIVINFMSMLALYRTGAAYVPYTVYLPLMLICAQTVSENPGRFFHLALAFSFLIISNFFPCIKTLDHYFGYFGRRIYTGLFKSTHQNPLGWQKYCFGDLKEQVIEELSGYSFAGEPRFLVENFGPLTSSQFVFFRNVLYPFPLMSRLALSGYQEMYAAYLEKGEDLFAELVQNGDIPILLYAIIDLPEEEMVHSQKIPLDELISREGFIIENADAELFVNSFNEAMISWADRNGVLESEYNCLDLPRKNPCARLCVAAEKPSSGKVRDFADDFLQELITEYRCR